MLKTVAFELPSCVNIITTYILKDDDSVEYTFNLKVLNKFRRGFADFERPDFAKDD